VREVELKQILVLFFFQFLVYKKIKVLVIYKSSLAIFNLKKCYAFLIFPYFSILLKGVTDN